MPFTIYPAIDIKGGEVVRLAEGDMDRATVYSDDPAEQARAFGKSGAEWLHVVDLDGATQGRGKNADTIERIIKAFPGRVQLGGGIRTRGSIRNWLDLGVDRVVLGTAALKDPELVKQAAADLPGRIVVAVDARGGFVTTEGWAETSDIAVVDLARRFEDAGVAGLLFTDVGRDGLLTGVNLEATRELAAAVTLPVIASGGVSGPDDIRALKKASATTNITGVIVGRALYDGRMKLAQALSIAG
ncbi:1-(5-phosphoribosyl)-5-[(5-phosphoribosylamino)methylideneamino]imidazole-4-carboxamide isomerase [Pacificimonas sp. WHA3]|uniref:1-(5-phosphoribosyl)-5-[(5-phosphoribosylamino)methylideneamino] imidazole-4-carboxamide isomerase n=1 Tax=Pacificimonas pallii TaxID=2827236 RepID=A0ABS6SBN0_9SPHN|nr:1-(5-phosphoribosyl)-5-[(5-phosphoribosylamino)methylideneamino]imidazole-4-carboxamide isomerase [Pacificimonas pallii]MBV7255824.1 1-(5-phosphoribosyl)-5-[(5-phosphoribosylamino)methylideneamino]imidazole-4-carboxamide isomerase [Pacificimonas pallii]